MVNQYSIRVLWMRLAFSGWKKWLSNNIFTIYTLHSFAYVKTPIWVNKYWPSEASIVLMEGQRWNTEAQPTELWIFPHSTFFLVIKTLNSKYNSRSFLINTGLSLHSEQARRMHLHPQLPRRSVVDFEDENLRWCQQSAETHHHRLRCLQFPQQHLILNKSQCQWFCAAGLGNDRQPRIKRSSEGRNIWGRWTDC